MTLFVFVSAPDLMRSNKCVFKKENWNGPVPPKDDTVWVNENAIKVKQVQWNLTSEEVSIIGKVYSNDEYDMLETVSVDKA